MRCKFIWHNIAIQMSSQVWCLRRHSWFCPDLPGCRGGEGNAYKKVNDHIPKDIADYNHKNWKHFRRMRVTTMPTSIHPWHVHLQLKNDSYNIFSESKLLKRLKNWFPAVRKYTLWQKSMWSVISYYRLRTYPINYFYVISCENHGEINRKPSQALSLTL